MTELSTSACGAATVEPLPGSLASVYPGQPLNSLVTSRSGHEAAVKMLVSCGKILRERVCNMAVEQFVVCTVECMLIIAHLLPELFVINGNSHILSVSGE